MANQGSSQIGILEAIAADVEPFGGTMHGDLARRCRWPRTSNAIKEGQGLGESESGYEFIARRC